MNSNETIVISRAEFQRCAIARGLGVFLADRIWQLMQEAEKSRTTGDDSPLDQAGSENGDHNSALSRRSERLREIADIIEEGDRRLQVRDGACGGLPPEITLEEWRRMYQLAIGEIEPASVKATGHQEDDREPPAR